MERRSSWMTHPAARKALRSGTRSRRLSPWSVLTSRRRGQSTQTLCCSAQAHPHAVAAGCWRTHVCVHVHEARQRAVPAGAVRLSKVLFPLQLTHQDKADRVGVKGKIQSYAPLLKYKVRTRRAHAPALTPRWSGPSPLSTGTDASSAQLTPRPAFLGRASRWA